MTRYNRLSFAMLVATLVWAVHTPVVRAAELDAPPVEFAQGDGRVTVAIDGLPVALYCYKHDKITRPFFAHVRAPNGVQVTRHHPPIEGQDLMDHDTFHPGIWMSFGDISGSDYWRIMAPVRHAEFVEQPKGGPGKGTFVVRNKYLDQRDPAKLICEEVVRYTFLARPEGYWILWDSTFASDHEFTFGDQEEMGLGFRVATPLRVEKKSEGGLSPGTGAILDSEGRMNGDEVWGNSAKWCDYSGTLAGERVGMTLCCHPQNFRASWFHARDYGFLEANPFGRQAFGKGEKSSIVVKPGDKLQLRYGILIHSDRTHGQKECEAAYRDYLQLVGK